ncbi:alpha-ketoglutarate-dependent sulfonate dioxygenase [Emericellopsis atlantica]|uniref:Alpha-ketoglutarate-dependent sulfonate dioxygenase n=1 Tax=Emericellopsis atlantica TaxID=2614577 RepID=A0A9P8CKF3_9HYPO|nr:alpha-ketoglutarate-dependent sulfonate dioxygenase [Emericellopsis atlantica]KAG9250303.1 alpha-ketoglutarate-dependent sulfonate dioxygenase [Emericellopsis atlantica]
MAPSATETNVPSDIKSVHVAKGPIKGLATLGHAGSAVPTDEPLSEVLADHREPLKLSGALDKFKYFESTPVIGREYVDANLAEILRAPNSDDLIRDLAITISQRGVVFFRKQDDITNDLQKELVDRLGKLSGKPASSGLHIHPVMNAGREDNRDDAISVISSVRAKKLYSERFAARQQSQKNQWHSDITFEPVPSDYTLLRLTQLPSTGGDTLWASGYEVYDRISKPLQSLLETLTATYAQPGFNEAAARNNFKIYTAERGSPENVGELLEAVHPVVRTNPVTGWKSLFAVGYHVQKINGLSEDESKHFLSWFYQLITENHDLQVRHRWENVNDLAIWDNRCVYHAATPDYLFGDFGERSGSRAVSVGERPYFDSQSKSRFEETTRAYRDGSK